MMNFFGNEVTIDQNWKKYRGDISTNVGQKAYTVWDQEVEGNKKKILEGGVRREDGGEGGRRRVEGGGLRAEGGGWRVEGGGWGAEGGGWREEGGRRREEVGKEREEGGGRAEDTNMVKEL
jgi:hypothetical protein